MKRVSKCFLIVSKSLDSELRFDRRDVNETMDVDGFDATVLDCAVVVVLLYRGFAPKDFSLMFDNDVI